MARPSLDAPLNDAESVLTPTSKSLTISAAVTPEELKQVILTESNEKLSEDTTTKGNVGSISGRTCDVDEAAKVDEVDLQKQHDDKEIVEDAADGGNSQNEWKRKTSRAWSGEIADI